MKKAIALGLSLIMVVLFALSSFGGECNHRYIKTNVGATCAKKAHTLYSCSLCGHSYEEYADSPALPDSFYILAKSERNGTTLTVTVELKNNPGLAAARLKMGYNASTLSLVEITNGNIWAAKDYSVGINIQNNPVTIYTEDTASAGGHNYKNGIYYTAVFEIIDPDGSYDISFSHKNGDFPDWDDINNSFIYRKPTIINIIGASEMGSHSFEFSKVVTEPTFTETGVALHICSLCGAKKTEPVPVLERWLKGDLNNDNSVNAIDSNLIKRLLAGISFSAQANDAADFNNDGSVNAMDSNVLKKFISGVD